MSFRRLFVFLVLYILLDDCQGYAPYGGNERTPCPQGRELAFQFREPVSHPAGGDALQFPDAVHDTEPGAAVNDQVYMVGHDFHVRDGKSVFVSYFEE